MASITSVAPAVQPDEPDLLGQLRQEGYSEGPPRRIIPQTLRIDAGAARCARCPRCDRRGMTFLPFGKGTSYRAVMQCKGCGHALEF